MIILRFTGLILLFFYWLPGLDAQPSQQAKDLFQDIAVALRSGDAESLASHFNSLVDLGLPEKDNAYSKSQGEIVMRDFFKKYPPDSFEVIQTGRTSETLHFAIGQYRTGRKKYQVSIYMQQEDNSYKITKIKFENTEP